MLNHIPFSKLAKTGTSLWVKQLPICLFVCSLNSIIVQNLRFQIYSNEFIQISFFKTRHYSRKKLKRHFSKFYLIIALFNQIFFQIEFRLECYHKIHSIFPFSERMTWTKIGIVLKYMTPEVRIILEDQRHGKLLKKWYFVTKIVLTYCEKKLFQ